MVKDIKWVEDYVLLDIETTGLSPQNDDIIEIGAIRVRENKITDTYTSLIKTDRILPRFITNLTGITNQMLDKGKDIDFVLEEFLDFIQDDTLMGHNVRFDLGFLKNKYKRYAKIDLNNNWIDTIQIAKKIVPEAPNYKLGTLARFFNINYDNAHRGLEDVKITYEVYNRLKQRYLCLK